MLYQINGKQIDIGEALQTHAKSVVDAIAALKPVLKSSDLQSRCTFDFRFRSVMWRPFFMNGVLGGGHQVFKWYCQIKLG
jgi:hypothetical protein